MNGWHEVGAMNERTINTGTQNIGGETRVATMMAGLLPVHRAVTPEWLVDAASTAAERAFNAPFAFVYFEEQDGRFAYKAPVSDLRRRSLQRAIDAFGSTLRGKIDPAK